MAPISTTTAATASSPVPHPARPRFHHQNTSDRLREALPRPPSFSAAVRKDRKSMFREMGLDDDEDSHQSPAKYGTPRTRSAVRPWALAQKVVLLVSIGLLALAMSTFARRMRPALRPVE